MSVLFDTYIGPSPGQIVKCHIQDTCCREALLSAEMQSEYSIAPVNWALLVKTHE